MTPADRVAEAACSFCGRGTTEVGHLIVGPNVWICDGCVRVCHGIIEGLEHRQSSDAGGPGPQPAGTADPVMAEIVQAQQMALRGDREGAAEVFSRIWDLLGPDGDPLHRVVLAHYLADIQDTAADELDWDLRALAVADALAGDHPASAAIRRLYASLQLNVASGLDKLGRQDEARRHLAKARAAETDLPADGYGELIRSEISALRARLGE